MSTATNSYDGWIGQTAYDRTGEKIGTIEALYYDDATSRPEWVAISTGWFGSNVSLAPITGSARHEDGLRLDVTEAMVKDAPNFDADFTSTADQESTLYSYYGITQTGAEGYSDPARAKAGYNVADRADKDYTTDTARMVRHEEELAVGKREKEVGDVRLRKYVTTEQETVTVPVKKEKVVLERQAVDGDTVADGAIGDQEASVTVHEEEVVVGKRTVAKEEVGLGTETVTGEEVVEADVRKEVIEVEDDSNLT